MIWYENPIAVPFGNRNYDVALGGSHNQTYLCTPNTVITSIVDNAVVTSIDSASWGKDIAFKLSEPVNGHSYFGYQHLSAVNPSLQVGDTVHYNDVIGWSGGCTSASQYDGTSNPTGQNFLDSPDMSSQPQVGIALFDGPQYGYDGGWSDWTNGKPIDTSLDPEPVMQAFLDWLKSSNTPDYKRQQFNVEFCAVQSGANPNSGIAELAYQDYLNGNDRGPALTLEFMMVDWNGVEHKTQVFGTGMYYWYDKDLPSGKSPYGVWHGYKS